MLCWLGFHQWLFRDTWEPSFDAPVITRFLQVAICRSCHKREVVADDRFDEDGVPE
jgi:hypothetical protein